MYSLKKRQAIEKRSSGILLHVTSLPSPYGIGDMGPQGYDFARFLSRAQQAYWQILPLNPPTLGINPYSPYTCLSAFAGNTFLLSPELLYRKGLLSRRDLSDKPRFPKGLIDYPRAIAYKYSLFKILYEQADKITSRSAYKQFCRQNRQWLDDFAVFAVLRRHFQKKLWCDWPVELRDRDRQAIRSVEKKFQTEIEFEKALQYLFFEQWFSLKRFCNRLGIRIIGDIPIYVDYDSADVWMNPELFKLTSDGKPRFISGVPPDYFSKTGQLWGNPVYDWPENKRTGYKWWLRRVRHNLAMFDLTRIDHFRGLVGYWQVPAGHKTAQRGKWVKGPGRELLDRIFNFTPASSIIVEDLGVITADVQKLIEEHDLTCMRVLQFAFSGDPAKNPHYPHNLIENSIVYTGTHDNNTTRGWFENEVAAKQKKSLSHYVGRKVTAGLVHEIFMRLALGSVAKLAVIPMQDVLGLGGWARMNRPSVIRNNWRWKLEPEQLNGSIAENLADMGEAFGRSL